MTRIYKHVKNYNNTYRKVCVKGIKKWIVGC